MGEVVQHDVYDETFFEYPCDELGLCGGEEGGCLDDDTAWVCEEDMDTPCEWKTPIECATGQTCVDGACIGDVTDTIGVADSAGTEEPVSSGDNEDGDDGCTASTAGSPTALGLFLVLCLALVTLRRRVVVG